MVHVINGNSEIGANERSDLGYMNFLRSRAVTIWLFLLEGPGVLHTCTTCFELPSDKSTKIFFSTYVAPRYFEYKETPKHISN